MAPKTEIARLLTEAMLEELAEKATKRADWPDRLEAARKWTDSYLNTDAEHTKETSLQSTFLHRVFGDALGYRDRGSGGKLWTLEAEPTTEVDAKIADGSIGFFRANKKVTKGVIELKDALTDLDAKQLTRRDRLSPVEQAFLYLVRYEGARYALVSNFRVLRLYAKHFGMTRYEEFDLLQIKQPESFARLLGTCSEETLLAQDDETRSLLDRFLSERHVRAQQEITEEFYEHYSTYRDRVVRYVADKHPNWGAHTIYLVQKFLDRILFILFAEDVGLLPSKILWKTIEQGLRSRARRSDRIWQELRFLFEDIDKGRPDFDPSINRYNGGLFAFDALLDDEFSLPDQLVEDLRSLEHYDFRTEIDVNILGHVFENSLVDIELLKREIALDSHDVDKTLAAVDQQRKNLGIYYTPSWVTHFVVDQSLGRYLQSEEPEKRLKVNVLDPACGSGAFLSEALSYLTSYSRSIANTAVQRGGSDLFDDTIGISAAHHLPQIFGIDLLPEAVEISKLSLWLRSAARSRPLADIETIVVGNTLASDDQSYVSTIVGALAKTAGFEIVIGNPPWGAKLEYAVDASLQLQKGQYDSYELFVERSLRDLCAPRGYFGFVIPDRILRPEGERLRRFLFDNYRVLALLKLGEGVFPGVFRAAVVIVVQNTLPLEDATYDGLIVTKQDRQELEEEGSARLARLMEQRGGSIAYSRVTGNSHYNIVLAPDQDISVAEKMDKDRIPWLGPKGIFGTYGRGEELGRDTFLLQCPGCFEWSVNPRKRAQRRGGGYELKVCPECGTTFSVGDAVARKSLVLASYNPRDKSQVPLYSGEQVNRYYTSDPMGLRTGIRGFDYKPEDLYMGPKLLIRQTGVGIYATLDDTNARCLQSVYVYRLAPQAEGRLEFFLAQLCSRAMLFYFYIRTNQVEWQSFPKLTHETLQELPLRRPDLVNKGERKRHDRVVKLVRERLRLAKQEKAQGPSEEAMRIDFIIEMEVSAIFGLEAQDVARITERLRPSQNIRIIRELYPAGQDDLPT